MNDLIKVLEGKRWFIWALVVVIAGLGSLAIYINYVNQTDNLVLSTGTVVHKAKTNTPMVEGAAVSIQGTVTLVTKGLPDTGGQFKVSTATNGMVTVLIPGNIKCNAQQVDSVAVGQQVLVNGTVTNGAINVCGSKNDFIKVSANALPTTPPVGTTLSNQYWDGSNLYMHIGSKDAQWVAGCSGGTISGPFKLDASGSFSLMGTYNVGPIMQGEPNSATYYGSVKGGTMILNIKYKDGTVNSYNLNNYKVPPPMPPACV